MEWEYVVCGYAWYAHIPVLNLLGKNAALVWYFPHLFLGFAIQHVHKVVKKIYKRNCLEQMVNKNFKMLIISCQHKWIILLYKNWYLLQLWKGCHMFIFKDYMAGKVICHTYQYTGLLFLFNVYKCKYKYTWFLVQ